MMWSPEHSGPSCKELPTWQRNNLGKGPKVLHRVIFTLCTRFYLIWTDFRKLWLQFGLLDNWKAVTHPDREFGPIFLEALFQKWPCSLEIRSKHMEVVRDRIRRLGIVLKTPWPSCSRNIRVEMLSSSLVVSAWNLFLWMERSVVVPAQGCRWNRAQKRRKNGLDMNR